MAAATIRVSWYGNSVGEPAGATAESGVTFTLSDPAAQPVATGVSPISIPVATGTDFSWIILLAFEVTGTGTTSINNRTLKYASAVTAGLQVFFGAQPTYRRPAVGSKPPASGSNGATPAVTGAGAPASYAAVTTSPQVFDSGTDLTNAAARNGDFSELVFAVDNTYAGGGGQAALPNLTYTYDEF